MSDFLILDDNKNSQESDNKFKNLYNWVPWWNLIEKLNNFIISIQKISIKEKIIFYRLLSTMMDAWITLIKAVSILEKQEKNIVFKRLLLKIYNELREWKTLSESLSLFPGSFTESEIWIIKSWEKTGQLNTVTDDLAVQIAKVDSISWKLKAAMIYPFFILIVVLLVLSVMMIMIVPKLLDIFEEKSTLPLSTKILINISDIFMGYWFLFIVIFGIIAIFISIWKKTPDWKYIYDSIILRLPIFWNIIKKLILSKFSRIFSWLTSSWVSVVESLKIVASSVWNEVYKQRILLLSDDISIWIKIWESLEWDVLFPDMMVQVIQVWEQTAKLDQTILKIADFYDDEIDNTTRILNKLLEPFIIVTLAVIVWFIAVAIMEPIMNLADTVSS